MSIHDELVEALGSIRSFSRGGQRAPHKPLLLLLALAAVQRGEGRWLRFEDVDHRMRRLLEDFGPSRRAHHPQYPFWRLQNDGVWEVDVASELTSAVNAAGDVSAGALKETGARGGLPKRYYRYLQRKPEVVNELAAQLLERSFPGSLHEAVLDAVGFPWVVVSRKRRDPRFRDDVLRIYERRCAVCGYDGRVGSSELGLEAAHLKWHAAGGPDDLDNGVALCSFHHVALDRGALTIDDDLRIQVSQHVWGGSRLDALLLDFIGKEMRRPQSGTPAPGPDYLVWHRTEVFREPARVAG